MAKSYGATLSIGHSPNLITSKTTCKPVKSSSQCLKINLSEVKTPDSNTLSS